MIIFGPFWFVALILFLSFIFKKSNKEIKPIERVKSKFEIILYKIQDKEKSIDKWKADIYRNNKLLELANKIYSERSKDE